MKSEIVSNDSSYGGCFGFEDSNGAAHTPGSSDMTDEDEGMSTGEGSAKENDRDIRDMWKPLRTAGYFHSKKTEDYHRRRLRNNLAVKKSRDKAKLRQKEFARHLEVLTAENKRLHMKAEVLMKELNLLRGLFPVVGLSPPPESDYFMLGN